MSKIEKSSEAFNFDNYNLKKCDTCPIKASMEQMDRMIDDINGIPVGYEGTYFEINDQIELMNVGIEYAKALLADDKREDTCKNDTCPAKKNVPVYNVGLSSETHH